MLSFESIIDILTQHTKKTDPLHHNSIYDYFCQCDFYENTCNNSIVLHQQISNFEQQLANLKGTEYKVDFETLRNKAHTNPIEYTSYNVILKSHRLSPKQTELRRIYYCPGVENHPQFGSIFIMPQINMVFNNKMRSATHHLNKAMELIIEHKNDSKAKPVKREKEKDKNEVKQNQYSSLVQGLIQSL